MNAVRRRLSAAGTVLVVLSGLFMAPERTADEARVFARADETAAAPLAPASPGSAPASPDATPAASASSAIVTAAAPPDAPVTAGVANGAPPAPKRGDLTHLMYSATKNLHAVLVAPALQDTVTTELARVAVSTGEGGGVELAVDGKIVPLTQLGARAVDKQSGESLYTFYGVRFAPGPNDVALTPLGAGDLRGETTRATVYGAGRPVALRGTLAGELRADGTTPVLLTVHALDAWHHPAAAGSAVRISVRRGDVKLLPAPAPSTAPDTSAAAASAADAAGATPVPAPGASASSAPVPVGALDVAVGRDGDARVLVVPGTVSGDASIGFTSGPDVSGDESLFVRPFLRKALVVGLLSAGAGAAPGSRDGDDHVDDGGSKRGRAAFFATGEALHGVASTIAYDTASRLAPSSALGPFVDDPDQRPYQTYGDTSTRRDDVLSKDRLYARFESGHDAFTYGRFDADTGPLRDAGASAFHEVLSGAKLDLADRTGRVRATAFSARNDVAYARRIIEVTGLSTFGEILHPDIVVGSDIVTLDALDTRTGAIVAERPLERNVDYVLDTLSGTLRFIEVPLPYDEFFRRQVVVVRYQYAGVGEARTIGGRLGASFGRGGAGEASVGYVNDAGGAGNFALLQQNLRLRTGLGTLDFAHVTSAGMIPGADGGASGQSWHAGYGAQRGGTRLSAAYDKTSAGFNDPFGGLAAAGLTDQLVALSQALPRKGELTLSYDAQRNDLAGASDSQSDASLTLRQPLSRRLTVEGGLDLRRATTSGALAPSILVPLDPFATPVPQSSAGPAATTTTTQARVAAQYTVGTRSAIRAERISDIGGSASASQPGETTLTIDQRLGDGTRLFARELWNDAPQRSFAAATDELATSGATHRTTVGFERKLGAATTVSSEYTVDHTANGSDLYSSIGVREVLKLSSRLRGTAFVQTAAGSGDASANAGSGFTAYGLDLGYATERFHATTSFQDRAGALGGTTLALGAAGALSPDMSLIGNLNSARNQGFRDTQARVGLAWRPHDNDNGAALLELERHDGTLATDGTRTDTLSVEAAWRPTHRFEMDSRVAYKLDGDGAYAAHTMLLGLREVQRIGSRFDVGYEMRLLSVPGISEARSTEFAAESGLRLGDSMRLALGYNFTGATDPALVGQKTRRGVYVTFTSVVSRVFGWGK
jgi:hypothetical protein